MRTVRPYGSWPSPISLDRLVEAVVRLGFPVSDGDQVYWLERRPADGGRQVVVRAAADGSDATDVTGPGYNARTLVHEYGGLGYAACGGTIYFSNFADQRLYRVAGGARPEPITPEPPSPGAVRFAAPVVDPQRGVLYAVRERHGAPDVPAEVRNDVVAVATDGSAEPVCVAGGHDFFSHIALSPDASRLAWVSWDHPAMPWDATELWEVGLGEGGLPAMAPRLVAGGPAESVIQPKYAPDGTLLFLSDRTGWWNLYADAPDGPRPRAPMDADLGEPDWEIGASSYAVLGDGSVVGAWWDGGLARLGLLGPEADAFEELTTPYQAFGALHAGVDGCSVLALAGSPSEASNVVRLTLAGPEALRISVLRRSRADVLDQAYTSRPEAVDFPTEGGLEAHALYYAPTNPESEAPEDERPPLIVQIHGGPTAAAHPVLDYAIQFWTTRGFAVVNVNYGGSSGYGRAYRERLKGSWGVVDVQDCVNAARYLATSGRADPNRLLIHGGSAGGYTTLCALLFHDVFAAGASYFGVSDAGALARDTHKFESHYTDGLIGPWPQAEDVYRARSPIFHTTRLHTPLILFQGLQDKVVPPAQAQAMVAALDRHRVPHAYIAYDTEQHGFRTAENIKRTAEAELYFYGRILGIAPADELAPVPIAHEDQLGS